MMRESSAIRVCPLTSVLAGSDPVEFVRRLIDAGYDGFYVEIPEGFEFRLLRFLRRPQIDYLRINMGQMRELMIRYSTSLRGYIVGGLELVSGENEDGSSSSSLEYMSGLLGELFPSNVANTVKVPVAFDASAGKPMVVKVSGLRRGDYSYELRGISFKDIFIEEPALSKAMESMHAAKAESVSVDVDLPADPYGLKDSSPLVYEILRKAYQNRDKKRNEVDAVSLRAEFRELNVNYKKNPKPFNDKRGVFAANLASRYYNYSAEKLRKIAPPRVPKKAPDEKFFKQEFINEKFGKLLYAACCWAGAKEPRLEGSLEGLVGLLIDLGFFDADDSDQVQSLVFFITGNKPKRDFKHFRAERR